MFDRNHKVHPSEWLLGFESLNGNGVLEREFEIYGRLVSPEDLTQAASQEEQEQWGVFIPRTQANAGEGTLRVRKINAGERYVETTKVKTPEGNHEVETEASEDRFRQFQLLADAGLHKTRYHFPIPGTEHVYEVDVFHRNDGSRSEWVKIDLELPVGMDIDDVPDLPIGLQDLRVIRPGHKSEQDKAWVRELFDREFNLVNPRAGSAPTLEGLENLDETQRRWADMINSCDTAASCLSFNEDKPQGEAKQVLEEASMLMYGALTGRRPFPIPIPS